MSEKIATREAYGKALAEFGEKYDFVVLDADLAEATKTGIFKKAFPSRFFDCGIAEGNMMSVAAGIAAAGKTVFASSFAMFAAGRAFEQVRNSIAYPHLNVKIGATHAGISVGEDGATHQCCEDIALMRAIPGMVVLNPADAVEARAVVEAALKHQGPVYMRFGRLAVETIFDKDSFTFEIGKAQRLCEGTDITIVSTGLTTSICLEAVKLLGNSGVSARLLNMASIKPIDKEQIILAAKDTGCILTVEEHNIIGGLGSAVTEVVCENYPCPVLRHGIYDTFGKSGKATDLLIDFGFTPEVVAEKAKQAVTLKK
ncbi:MAG: transketolase [Clostridiales bacterium]|nr:MAG: transketolase [Clostridiales bacterium]